MRALSSGSSVQALPLLHVSDLPWVGSRKWGSPPITPNQTRYPEPEFGDRPRPVLDLPPAHSFSRQAFLQRAAVASPEQKLAVFTPLYEEGVGGLFSSTRCIDVSWPIPNAASTVSTIVTCLQRYPSPRCWAFQCLELRLALAS